MWNRIKLNFVTYKSMEVIKKTTFFKIKVTEINLFKENVKWIQLLVYDKFN